jgi:hypothetical protein
MAGKLLANAGVNFERFSLCDTHIQYSTESPRLFIYCADYIRYCAPVVYTCRSHSRHREYMKQKNNSEKRNISADMVL